MNEQTALKHAALGAVGSVLAAGTLLSTAASGQDVLPRPDPPFNGHIGRTDKESTPDKFTVAKAPDGAPNTFSGKILKVVIDSKPANLTAGDVKTLTDGQRKAALALQ